MQDYITILPREVGRNEKQKKNLKFCEMLKPQRNCNSTKKTYHFE